MIVKMNEELLTSVLLLASIIAVVSPFVVEAIKNMFNVPKNILPAISVVVGVALALGLYPFTDAEPILRVWAGVLSGLSGTGAYETIKKRLGNTKGE
jgi:hypothetical protein